MIRRSAWLGVAALMTLVCAARPAHAVPGDPLKPYVVLVLDTSGSMVDPTGSGTPSCGGADTKLNHANCAINQIVNSYGDIVFGLGRFRMSMSGTTTAATFPAGCATAQDACTATDDRFELLTPLIDGNNDLASAWTNRTGNTCTAVGSNPEVWKAVGSTPLGGALLGTKRYWIGAQASNGTVIWAMANPGFNPIVNDPTNQVFFPQPGANATTCNSNRATCNAAANCTGTNCCCGEQCRPYITILLTDGDETCGGNAPAAATSLLSTDVTTGGALRRYRVETKPIGFGKPPGDAEIEAIAHAGGAGDAPGVNEGYYATDEAGLQLAISSILADAIRTESCNNLDDDCDVLIDEDFPNKGMACDNGKVGVCRTTGVQVCRTDFTGLTCTAAAGPAPGTETCNMLDDDCDGKTDEGLTGCTCIPQGEQCNNADDDCDGKTDEGITRACGTGTCTGIETCAAGVFGGCTAPPFNPVETCNGLDDNCDGVIDGLTLACSNLVTPGGPATGNPGGNPASACTAEGPAICLCHPGTKVCPAGGGGAFGACLGEQGPVTEVCNGLDDDCDGRVDEGTGGADCSTNCGVGTTVCTAGTLMCNAMPAPNDDTCDGNDDDCDGNVDEDYVSPGACGTGMLCNGLEQCINGVEQCIGDPVLPESCNCGDDDCDGQTDEGSLCPSGASCTNCQCAFQCSPGEFPCPAGKRCSADNFCIADACYMKDCPPVGGNPQVCVQTGNAGNCVDKCSTVTCPGTQVCVPELGECRPDDCTTFPDRCTAQQNCVAGECVTNLCAGVTCTDGQYCVAGNCVTSCAGVTCPDGQRCDLGMCEADPCGHQCPFGQVCNDDSAMCVNDPCTVVDCPQGQECDPHHNGNCVASLCTGTSCPDPSQVCQLGTCVDPSSLLPDAAGAAIVTTGGGGGCSTSGGNSGVVTGLLIGLAVLAQRKRRGARTVGGSL